MSYFYADSRTSSHDSLAKSVEGDTLLEALVFEVSQIFCDAGDRKGGAIIYSPRAPPQKKHL